MTALLYFGFLLLFGWLAEGVRPSQQYGGGECARGQAFWCQNIKTASRCGAVKHCIQGVWEHEVPIERDPSEICQTCLNMVRQARDQLESNQTQEEIKLVLEGSCYLIPIKLVSVECVKLMDEFAPQLIDTLASQMNPQVVCSVAGLCNSARVHVLEHQYKMQNGKMAELNCDTCGGIIKVIQGKLSIMTNGQFLNSLNNMCMSAGSYSEGCLALAEEQHPHLLAWIKDTIREGQHTFPRTFCHLTAVCQSGPRIPAQGKVTVSGGEVGVRVIEPMEDLPCDLCKQLVQHLRDILVSNTTEEEFKQTLLGICSQLSSSYKDQCTQYVNQYYSVIYEFLVDGLDGKTICTDINICPPTLKHTVPQLHPAMPALPSTRYDPLSQTLVPSSFLPDYSNGNVALCSMCEYFLHFVQQEITLPSTEEKIKQVLKRGCDKLSQSVRQQCDDFVSTYINTLVALLAQEIDPSLVCPKLGVCPGALVAVSLQDKPSCPLCLLAIQELNDKFKDKPRTTLTVGDAVDDLCIRDEFPSSVSMECVELITQHKESIVDQVLAELSPQESCVFMQLCVPPKPTLSAGDIGTNEIIQDPDRANPNSCVLCEFILTKVEQLLKDRSTEDEIREAVTKVCDYMPKTVTAKCHKFMDEYAQLLIELLAQEMDPKQVCTAINLCGNVTAFLTGSLERCLMCEVLMDGLKTVLTDKEIDMRMNDKLMMACNYIPQREKNLCLNVVSELAPQLELALRTLPVGPLVCERVNLCTAIRQSSPRPVAPSACRLGSAYWCQSTVNAATCKAIEFCQQEVWKGDKPRKSVHRGTISFS